MRIYLTGFMASGKSTVGPRAAARLGLSFLDLDRLITAHDGRSIPDIFAEDGEAHFRTLERRLLRRTAETDDLVVALGGGALVDATNRAFAQEHGRTVYLKVPVEAVLERVAHDEAHRPLLQDDAGAPLPPDAQRARIEDLLDERRPHYNAADATVDAGRPVEAVVQAVVAASSASPDETDT